MGTMSFYKCKKCNYEVEIVAGYDFGMIAVLETYICKDCNIITDVEVGEHGIKILKKDIKNSQFNNDYKDFYKCNKCSGENLQLWNTKLKKCPKCRTKMAINYDKPFTKWD